MMLPGLENILTKQNIGIFSKDFQIGAFIFLEKDNRIYFQDAQQKAHDLGKVFLLSNEWNFAEGEKNFPKPFVYDETGAIKDYGAFCLYAFIDASVSNIIVLGQVVNPVIDSPDDKLDFNFNNLEELLKKNRVRNNDKRYYSVSDDGKGNLVVYLQGKETNGNIVVKLIGQDNQSNGNLKLELNGKFLLNQVTDDGEIFAQILLDNTKDAELIRVKDKYKNFYEMNKKGTIIETATIRIGKDETVAKILKDLIAEIRSLRQPTTAGGPTLSPLFNDANFAAILKRLNKFMDIQ